jgi:AraC family transcriptional regulator, positive regulator of tynA and feaB
MSRAAERREHQGISHMRVQGSGYWSQCSPGRADASGCSPRWRALLRCIISGRCKLLRRIRGVIKDRFADPDFGPCDVAAEAGISLRYVQKLFTERGSTCSEFIYSLRLDHAAHLLHRRTSLGTSQPLSDIAYACGFRDYTHFARKFRHRFGHAPGAHSGGNGRAGDGTVRASTGNSASWAHDV